VSVNNSQELMMRTKYALFLKLIGSLFALVLLAAPSLGVALTITQVKVVVGGATYCDTTVAGCPNPIWDLNGGVTLTSGQTLILTQNDTEPPGNARGGTDFDTSDRGGNTVLSACSTADGTPCATQIFINGVLVVDTAATVGNPLNAFNDEPHADTGQDDAFQEDEIWVAAPGFTGTGYTLELGYADNIHAGACNGGTTGCFPQHVWATCASSPQGCTGTGAATVFLGQGLPFSVGQCAPSGTLHTNQDAAGNTVGCYDGGALRITEIPVPHLKVVKTPKSPSTFASGSQLTYTVVVSNDGEAGSIAHNVTLDDVLPGNGGLVWTTATPTQGTCTNPIASNTLDCELGDIAQGSSVTVTITSTATTPAAACQDQPNPAADATDTEGDKATDSGDQKCTPPPSGLIAPTQTTCQDVLNGTASTLGQINYSVSGGKIGQGINPGVFFYFAKITVAAGTVTVTESQNDAAALFKVQQGQAKLYTGDCSSSTAGTLNAGSTGASFSIAAAGNYIISIKYSAKSIAGTTAPTSDPVTYTFTATPPGASSSASVLLKKQ
jgi:uncharacterized repeat protein (TIGR01451 family)